MTDRRRVGPGHDAMWRLHAACRAWFASDVEPDPFEDSEPYWHPWFPERQVGQVNRGMDARAICATCPVRAECLNEALLATGVGDDGEYGVWGGSSERQRRVWRRLLRASSHRRRGFVPGCRCPLCREVEAFFGLLRRAYDDNGELRHGTGEAYWVGCRCRGCSSAAAEARAG